MNNRRLPGYCAGLLAAAATLGVYLAALENDFVHWDDDRYVLTNQRLAPLDTALVAWAFVGSRNVLWHPLTWLSHALDRAAWGLDPWGHHLTSVILHALNTLLVYLVASALLEPGGAGRPGTGRRPAIAAAAAAFLFGLHPLHVESVAWVSERKDVLSAFFCLAALHAYVRYAAAAARHHGRSRRSVAQYVVCLGLFTLALLSKPMVVTLPLTMLIVDWHPLGRLADRDGARRALLEKVPFFALSLATAAITIVNGGLSDFGMAARPAVDAPLAKVLVASRSITFYLEKMAWPAGLSPLYLYPPDAALSQPRSWGSLALVLALTAGAFRTARRRKVFAAVWASYLVTLLPVLGVIRIGPHAVADRYAYLSSIPVFLLCGLACSWCWGAIAAATRARGALRAAAAAGGAAALCVLSWLTLRQIAVWKDTETLFRQAIAVTPGNWWMHKELGIVLARQGRYPEAIENLAEALRILPSHADIHANLGYVLLAAGRTGEAEARLRQALALDGTHLRARLDLGSALERLERFAEARGQFEEALGLAPASDEARFQAARFHVRRGDAVAAERHLAAHPMARLRLADFLASEGEDGDAERHYREALRQQPQAAAAHNGWGVILARRGDLEAAAAAFSRAIALRPRFSEAHYNLGKVLDQRGRVAEAVTHYREAVASDPSSSDARNNLGVDLILLGADEEGLAEIREAVRLDPGNREARANLELFSKPRPQ